MLSKSALTLYIKCANTLTYTKLEIIFGQQKLLKWHLVEISQNLLKRHRHLLRPQHLFVHRAGITNFYSIHRGLLNHLIRIAVCLAIGNFPTHILSLLAHVVFPKIEICELLFREMYVE